MRYQANPEVIKSHNCVPVVFTIECTGPVDLKAAYSMCYRRRTSATDFDPRGNIPEISSPWLQEGYPPLFLAECPGNYYTSLDHHRVLSVPVNRRRPDQTVPSIIWVCCGPQYYNSKIALSA